MLLFEETLLWLEDLYGSATFALDSQGRKTVACAGHSARGYADYTFGELAGLRP